MSALSNLAWLAPLLFSPAAGSMMGVVIARLPEGKPVALDRPQCDACGRMLIATDLVPIFSYIALKGRCRTCVAPIASFHLVVELAAVAVAAWATLVHTDPYRLWADCVSGWVLLALALIDWRYMRLPDALTLPLIAFGLATTALITPALVVESIVGAILGYFIFKAVAMAYRTLRGRDGLGGGDAKLLAASGALVGWAALPDVIVLAALFGIGGAAVLRVSGRATSGATAVPFGPFLALATWIVRLHGPLVFGATT